MQYIATQSHLLEQTQGPPGVAYGPAALFVYSAFPNYQIPVIGQVTGPAVTTLASALMPNNFVQALHASANAQVADWSTGGWDNINGCTSTFPQLLSSPLFTGVAAQPSNFTVDAPVGLVYVGPGN